MAVKLVRVKVGERWYTVEVEEPLGSPAKATVEGHTILVELEGGPPHPPNAAHPSGTPPAPATRPPASSPAAESGLISSPMSGKVLSVRVKPGETVAAGDEVCVVEAMKMEQSIRAPREGTVKLVHVTPLQQITIRAPLVELE